MRQCFKRIMALGLVLLLIFSVGMQSQTYAEEETPTSQSSGNAADQSLPYNGSKDEPAPEASPSGQPQDPAPEASPSGQPQDPAPEASPSGQPQDPAPEASPSGQSQEPDPDASQSGQSQEPDPEASPSGQSQDPAPEDSPSGQPQEPEYEERLLELGPGQEELIDFGPDAVITLEEISSQFIDFSAQEGKLSICALKDGQDSFKADVVSPTLELHIEYIVTVSQQAENSDDTQQEETEMVTATFDYGEEKTETKQYEKGSPLGALPQADAPEGYSFLGWEYTDSQGVPQYAGEDTLISEDTLYTARFSETAVPALVPNSLNSGRDADYATCMITFYIAIDDAWVSLGSREMTARKVGVFDNGTENRYCLTAEQLAEVYGSYGFKAGDMTLGSRLFPHTTPEDQTIYGDRMVSEHNGVLYSPLLTAGVDCDVYYLPNAEQESYYGNRDSYASSNSFYTVEVIDPGNKVYGQGEPLPPTAYVLTGEDYTVRVEAAEGVTWQCVGKNGIEVTGTYNEDGTVVSFTINSISQSYTVSPALRENETLITYHINLPHEPSDPEYWSPTIEGKEIHQLVETETHDVLAPSYTEYFYYHDGKYLGTATFLGWQVEDTDILLQPGDKHNLEDHNGSLTLKAQWETKEGGVQKDALQSSIVNFYVSLAAIPEGGTSWTGSTSSARFTDSVFSSDCGITGQLAIDNKLYHKNADTQYFVLGDTSGVDLNNTHTSIVSNLTQGYSLKGSDNNTYTFRLSFPPDEEILRHIRSLVSGGNHTLTLNGKEISPEDLTSANFTIKWYVFKVDRTDGWHVDGILVAKTGMMQISKTFSGDQDVVQAIKNGGYSIKVEAQPSTDFTPPHSGYTLTLGNADSYDSASDTYTWQVEVDQYLDYKITEQNYQYQNEQTVRVQTAARYRVYNSKFFGQNTGGYKDYPEDGITVTGQSAAQSGQQLTLSFINTYTKPGTMSIIKMDALTQSPMPNIKFEIKKVGDDNFTLYDLGNSHYSIDPKDGNNPQKTNTIITDASGQAFLYLGTGSGNFTFTFTEEVPKGYADPGTITVVMDASGRIDSAKAENSSDNRVYTQVENSELQINNYSRLVPLTVEKEWLDGENTPVTLQLYYNGQNMAADFKKELSGDTWRHTFENDVPLYMGGSPVEYSLLETEIGDWSYSEQLGGDGYRYYDVSYTPMQYLDDTGKVTNDLEQAEEIYLKVSNRRSTGQLSISKLDQRGQPLPGAVFYLYPAENTESGNPPEVVKDLYGNYIIPGQTKLCQAVSDGEGNVSFAEIPTGNYYLIEHQSPVNYYGTDSLYLVELQSTYSFVLKQWDGTGWVPVQSRSISNELQYVSVNIQKIVKGNLGIFSKSFGFTVTSDKPMKPGTGYALSDDGMTATFSLKHREKLNLMAEVGSTLTITETDLDGYAMSIATADGITITGSYTVPSDGTKYVDIVVTNTKNANIDTGIVLDSLPYVLILALAGTGGLLLIKKGRRRRDR